MMRFRHVSCLSVPHSLLLLLLLRVTVLAFLDLFSSLFPQRQDARIIVGLFYETEARKVFCEVRSLVL